MSCRRPTAASRSVRSAGFTTAVTFPDPRHFRRTRLCDRSVIGAKRPARWSSVPSVGQYISLSRVAAVSAADFPVPLMGYISYVRQIYLDAAHYKLVKDAYAKNPRGMQRPEYDRALEGVLDSKRILLPANRLVEIDRMIALRRGVEAARRSSTACARAYRPEAADAAEEGRLRRSWSA